ncbi:tripartite motif-containing protein 10-like isoform X1 [Nematostella vectensis]|uniref:tripartite motif-containing protein 10-like isoform X1 n=1 Tax=Nematostella vectensis TaxID=45351 RepID=UPI0020773E96|nr:tripartite motif-containing protein 10-like isoform X1 [Nematostella vectensis]
MACNIIDELKNNLKCSICGDVLSQPKTLPCLHHYCAKCIDPWIKTCSDQGINSTCPECRSPFKPGDVKENFSLNKMLDLSESLEKLSTSESGNNNDLCDNCFGSEKIAYFCYDCECLVCKTCLERHGGHSTTSKDGALAETKIATEDKVKKMEKVLFDYRFLLDKSNFELQQHSQHIEAVRKNAVESITSAIIKLKDFQTEVESKTKEVKDSEQSRFRSLKDDISPKAVQLQSYITHLKSLLLKNSAGEFLKERSAIAKLGEDLLSQPEPQASPIHQMVLYRPSPTPNTAQLIGQFSVHQVKRPNAENEDKKPSLGPKTSTETYSLPNRPTVPFRIICETDQMVINGVTTNIMTQFQSTAVMSEYENISFEELRLDDYQLGRRVPSGVFNQAVTLPSMFEKNLGCTAVLLPASSIRPHRLVNKLKRQSK